MGPRIKAIYKTFLNGRCVKDGLWAKQTKSGCEEHANYFGFYIADNFLQYYIIDKKSIGIDLDWENKI